MSKMLQDVVNFLDRKVAACNHQLAFSIIAPPIDETL